MNAKEALKTTQALSALVLKSYISDLSDAELMHRPGTGCNHLAWQLGHLIAAECHLLEAVVPGGAAKLPEQFAEQHSKATAGSDDPAKFCNKETYLKLFDQVQAATAAALDRQSESDLDKPSPPEYQSFAPTVGSMFALICTHPMMHAGQFVPVRRKLGKAILM